jgi:hypothetical protein
MASLPQGLSQIASLDWRGRDPERIKVDHFRVNGVRPHS